MLLWPLATSRSTSRSRSVSWGNTTEVEAGRAESLQEPFGCTRPEDDVSSGGCSDGMHDVVLGGAFQEVAACAGPQRGIDRIGVLVHGEDDDGHAWEGGGDLAGGVEAMTVRHLEVEQDDVGDESAVTATASSPWRLRRRLRCQRWCQQGTDALADDLVIVGDDHRDPFDVFPVASVVPVMDPPAAACTRPPPVGPGPACRSPPSSRAREAIEVSPTPGRHGRILVRCR